MASLLFAAVAAAQAREEPDPAALASARGADRLALLTRLAASRVDKDPAQASRWADEALALAQALDDRHREAEAVYLLADAARAAGEHRLALERFRQARELFARLGNRVELGRSLRRIGDLCYFLGDLEQALSHYLEALKVFEDLAGHDPKSKGPLHVAHLHTAIGNVLRASQDTTGARQAYEQALADYQRLDYPAGVAGAYYNLGLVEDDLGRRQEALDHFEKARAAAVGLGDDYLLSLALSSAGAVHRALGDLDQAEALVRQAMQICERTQRARGILSNLLRLAEIQQGRGAHRDAAATLAKAIELATRLGDVRGEADAHAALAISQEALGDPRAALASLRRFITLDHELVGADKTSRIKKLQIAYETAKREQEIALLTAQRQRDRLLRSMVLGALASTLLVLGLVVSRYRLRVRTAREIAATNAQLELAYARVEELSRTDDLTALPNRRAILERLALERARCERTGSPLALALADVDDFKRCNDRWGHDCGDQVLRVVADTLRGAVRTTDAVGRLGGEEFLLVFPDTGLEGAAQAAEKVRAWVEATPIPWRDQEVRVTVTLGVCAAQHETVEGALRRADQAMYLGKRNGKNRVEVAISPGSTGSG